MVEKYTGTIKRISRKHIDFELRAITCETIVSKPKLSYAIVFRTANDRKAFIEAALEK